MVEECIDKVWVFSGAEGRFPGGVFTKKELAEEWIAKNGLTGILTLYPLNTGVYDWATGNNLFLLSKDFQRQPGFIQKFSSASQEHFHYEDGKLA